MKTRVLSGTLVTRDAPEGTAVIEFLTNTLAGGHTPGVHLAQTCTAGDDMPTGGAFLHEPAHMISLREVKIVETEWVAGRWHEGNEIDDLRINRGRITPRTLEIKWQSSGGSRIEEISYMVIGDVARD